MNEPDSLLSRLRALPSPSLDAAARARVLRVAQSGLAGERGSALVRAWSSWGPVTMLLACEAVYLADFFGKLRVIFFG